MTELKQLEWSNKTFEANGRKYYINTRMSIYRAIYAEEAKIEMETGQTVGKNFESYNKIFSLLNEMKPAEAAVEAYNAMRSIETFF